MSGGAFNYFYFAVEEAMLSHVNGLDMMIAEVQDRPDHYDSRTLGILQEIRTSVVLAQVKIHEANLILHDVEYVASGDYGPDTLKRSIEAYLEKRTHE